MKKKVLLTSLIATAILSFIGCGSSGGSSYLPPENTTQTGNLVDAPIEGLKYTTPTHSGFTDANGKFEYEEGELVTFYLGNLPLATIPAKKLITPLTLAGDINLNSISTKAIAIARILQSLDSDQANPDTLIIPTNLAGMDISALDLEVEADLNTILAEAQIITSQVYVLKDATTALNAMKDFLQSYLYNGSYTGSAQHTGGTLPICPPSMTFTISVSNGTNLSGITSEGDLLSAFNLINSTVSGTTSNNVVWNATINEDGGISGSYNYDNGKCMGTISGYKN